MSRRYDGMRLWIWRNPVALRISYTTLARTGSWPHEAR